MTLKTLPLALALAALPIGAAATPYCDALLDADALPGKYARLAPIHSSTETGWVFTKDMMSEAYAMDDGNLALVEAIVASFTRRDIPLAIVVAPPRPVVAGQAIVDATAGAGALDVAAAQASFEALVAQLRGAGAIAPNLAATATQTDDIRAAFYFKRDTHWTARGAALSAQALSAEIAAMAPALGIVPADLPGIGTEAEEEKGSLAAILRDVCQSEPDREPFLLADLPAATGDLLGGGSEDPSIVLLGTSFSNRYKTDFYRVGEAMSWALDRPVENISASGTGMIGMIEGFVRGGGLDRKPDLVIWETPYTQSFNSPSDLRQLLGALQAVDATDATRLAEAQGAGTLEIGAQQPDLLLIDTGTTDAAELRVNIRLADGGRQSIKLRRNDRVPAEMRGTVLAASLLALPAAITAIEVEPKNGVEAAALRLSLHRTQAATN